jgi:uncharacterized protein YbjT (DUF2867 family)
MKNILVLGGTGFVGAHVCEKLVAQGWHVTVATRRRRNARHLLPLPFTTVLEMDVYNDAAIAQVVQGMDAVVNLVAILHGNQDDFERVHVALPQKVARACVTAGVPHLVHISALGADARTPEAAPSLYLRSKGYGEAALRRAVALTDLQVTVLRPSVIFGAEDKFLNVFAKLQKLAPFVPLAGAHARFQPVWVEDVATAVERCLAFGMVESLHGKQPSVLEACGPDIYTLKELVQLAGQWSGANNGQGRPVIALPDVLGRFQALLMECLPGEPLMSRDNLDSMRIDNVSTGLLPGLEALGITPAALKPIAQDYLTALQPTHALLGIRQRVY